MRHPSPLVALALALSSVPLFAARPAAAQSAAQKAAMAQALYESGTQLLERGEHAAACPKLEESQRLDPAMGTSLLATCSPATGRPTSAWSLFLEVAGLAHRAGNPMRESTARARAAALEPHLPRLTAVVPEAVAALPRPRSSATGSS